MHILILIFATQLSQCHITGESNGTTFAVLLGICIPYTAFTLCSRRPRQPRLLKRSYISLFSRSITSCDVFLRCITISITSRGSDKPVCHGGAKVRYGCPRSITIINTFYHGLLRSFAVSCVLTKE